MGYGPRWVPSGALVEVTQETINGHYPLRLSRDHVKNLIGAQEKTHSGGAERVYRAGFGSGE